MGFTVGDTIALLNRSQADGLRQMTLAGARGTEKQAIVVPGDEGAP